MQQILTFSQALLTNTNKCLLRLNLYSYKGTQTGNINKAGLKKNLIIFFFYLYCHWKCFFLLIPHTFIFSLILRGLCLSRNMRIPFTSFLKGCFLSTPIGADSSDIFMSSSSSFHWSLNIKVVVLFFIFSCCGAPMCVTSWNTNNSTQWTCLIKFFMVSHKGWRLYMILLCLFCLKCGGGGCDPARS